MRPVPEETVRHFPKARRRGASKQRRQRTDRLSVQRLVADRRRNRQLHRAEANHVGMAFANGAKAMVSRSLIANNVSLGIDAENVSGGAGAQVALDNGTVNNGSRLFTFNGGVLDVSNSNVAFNASRQRRVVSFGNNRVHPNTAAGTPPTAIGALTHDVGQQ